jgi:hypothetical protein
MAKEVLLERLSTCHPFEYNKQFDPNPIPPNIYPIDKDIPSWYRSDIRKRRFKIGRFRALRTHSAVQPLDNNPDLDQPIYPSIDTKKSPYNMPYKKLDHRRRPKLMKDTLWVKPANQHPTFVVQSEHILSEEDKLKMKFKKGKN